MHNAPAVSYPVGRSRFHGLLVATVAACGAILLTTWITHTYAGQGRHLAAALLWLISTGLAARNWMQTPSGALTWDGAAWTWTCRDELFVVVPVVVLDSQGNLLLRLHGRETGHQLWIWPQRRTFPQRWIAFRRAVFGQVPSADGLGAAPTSAHDRTVGVSL